MSFFIIFIKKLNDWVAHANEKKAGSVLKLDNIITIFLEKHIHLIKYAIIGLIGLIVDFSAFYILFSLIGTHYLTANVISVILALTHNFLLNAFFNFKVKDKLFKRYLFYLLFGTIGLLISSTGLYILIEYFFLNELISKGVVLLVVTLLQYLVNKKITFKNE